MLAISISSAGVGAISPRFFGIWHRLVIVRQAPGPREVHLALGVIRRGVDLGSPDGLYAGRDRLEKSATDMATAERRLSQIKSVSYTHLRAHETDSYIVCRLLLEK